MIYLEGAELSGRGSVQIVPELRPCELMASGPGPEEALTISLGLVLRSQAAGASCTHLGIHGHTLLGDDGMPNGPACPARCH